MEPKLNFALSHLPKFFPCTSHKLYSSHFSIVNTEESHQFWYGHNLIWKRTPRRGVPFLCAAKKPRNPRKPTLPKPDMSDTDICNAIREFVSAEGLPGNHVPSMAELSRRGRKDLAGIVRRRGYNFVAELLRSQKDEDIRPKGNLATNKDSKSECSDVLDGSSNVLTEDEDIHPKGNLATNKDSKSEFSDVLDGSSNVLTEDESVRLSPIGNYIHSTNGSLKVKTPVQSDEFAEHLRTSCGSAVTLMMNKEAAPGPSEEDGIHPYVDQLSNSKVNYGNLRFNDTEKGSMNFKETTTFSSGQISLRDGDSLGEVPSRSKFNADTIRQASRLEEETEINRLKTMLHKKERELSMLKKEIEKEKLALSALWDKANAEINNIQSRISAKDAELRAAEEGLLGLKEVKIEYQAHGEIVEVTGSFNGWHHRIKMDRNPLPDNGDLAEMRESNSWMATLWLYPGVYEIKFIVDGQWRTDFQRELITRGHATNNILRVER